MITCKTQFINFKDLTINSSNADVDHTLTSNDDEVNIPVVAEVVRAYETDENILNRTPGPPVEVFTTMMINVSE